MQLALLYSLFTGAWQRDVLSYNSSAYPVTHKQHVTRDASFNFLRRHLEWEMPLTLSLAKRRKKGATFMETWKLFIYRHITYFTNTFHESMLKIAKIGFEFLFFVYFFPLPVYFYCTWRTEKFTGKIMRTIIIIYSSLRILYFMLPACRPRTAEVARITQKPVLQTCSEVTH